MTDAGDDLQFPNANIVALEAVAGVLASSLGPTPHDTLIVNRLATREQSQSPAVPATDDYVVTSDGATALEELPIEHSIGPIVKRMVGPHRKGDTDIEGQDIPDGITTRVVLAAALLDEAQRLIDLGVHPNDVQRGFERGLSVAHETMRASARTVTDRTTREAVARTALTGNDLGGYRDRWASLAVDAVDHIGVPDEVSFAVRTIEAGSIDDSRLVEGAVLDRNERASEEMPRRVDDARVLVLGGHETGGLTDPDTEGIKRTASLDHPDRVFEDHFAARRAALVEKLVDAGVSVVVARGGINRAFQRLLADNDILGIRSVNRLKLQQVAHATGAAIVNHPDDFQPSHLGRAGRVEEVRIEKRRHRRKFRRMVVFDDCSEPTSVALLLRGVSGQVAQQAETELRKAAMAVARADGLDVDRRDLRERARGNGQAGTDRVPRSENAGVVPGGGAMEVRIADAVRSAPAEGSRAQLAMEGFADAVDHLVTTLARNAGLDPLSVLPDIRAAQRAGDSAGLVFPDRVVGDVEAAGVFDALSTRLEAYETALQVATLVVRIDDAMDATFTKEPSGPDDVIYDERAEKHEDWLEEEGREGTVWN